MIPTEDLIPLKDWYQYRHSKRNSYMPRKRKTLEKYLSELMDEFGPEKVKAATDMMHYLINRPGGYLVKSIQETYDKEASKNNRKEVSAGVKTETS